MHTRPESYITKTADVDVALCFGTCATPPKPLLIPHTCLADLSVRALAADQGMQAMHRVDELGFLLLARTLPVEFIAVCSPNDATIYCPDACRPRAAAADRSTRWREVDFTL
jgi:hypothetical protein